MRENRNNLTCIKTNVLFDSPTDNNICKNFYSAYIVKTFKLKGETNTIICMSSTLQSRDVLVTLPEVGQAEIVLQPARELGLHPGTFLKKS